MSWIEQDRVSEFWSTRLGNKTHKNSMASTSKIGLHILFWTRTSVICWDISIILEILPIKQTISYWERISVYHHHHHFYKAYTVDIGQDTVYYFMRFYKLKLIHNNKQVCRLFSRFDYATSINYRWRNSIDFYYFIFLTTVLKRLKPFLLH